MSDKEQELTWRIDCLTAENDALRIENDKLLAGLKAVMAEYEAILDYEGADDDDNKALELAEHAIAHVRGRDA